MDWQDEAFVLSATRFGESDAMLEALTRGHGRHLGLVKGGMARTRRPVLQPGNRVTVAWKARLSEHLGRFEVEPVRSYATLALDSAHALAALSSAAAVASACVPERELHPAIFEGFAVLMDTIASGDAALAAAVYVKWEVGLLQDLGFGLDLSRCAVTGTADDLAYVSPRSGRAVNRTAAGIYADRLLRLPAFLLASQAGDAGPPDLADGFRLTGHFLAQSVLAPHDRDLPAVRGHYVDLATR